MLRAAAATHLRRHIITQRRRIATPEAATEVTGEEPSPEEEARIRRENIRIGNVDIYNHPADVDTDEEADGASRGVVGI